MYVAVLCLNALVESANQEGDGEVVTGFISLGAQIAFEVAVHNSYIVTELGSRRTGQSWICTEFPVTGTLSLIQ